MLLKASKANVIRQLKVLLGCEKIAAFGDDVARWLAQNYVEESSIIR